MNILGEGVKSEQFAVYVSDMPEIMQPVTTSIVGTKLVVDWLAPDDNNDPIVSYEVKFVDSLGALVSISPECDGSDPLLTSCEVEMQRVRDVTGLQRGSLIKVQVRAVNSYDFYEPRMYPDMRQLYS